MTKPFRITPSRWYLREGVTVDDRKVLLVHAEFGSFKSYTAADRLLHENDPDYPNAPGFVMQRRREDRKHLWPIKGKVLLTDYANSHRIVQS